MYYSPVDTGKRILHLRRQAKLTQEQLADKLGISDRHLRNIEAGERSASYDTLFALTELFNVTTDYILKGEVSSSQTKTEAKKKLQELALLLEKI